MKLRELLTRMGVEVFKLKEGTDPEADIVIMPEQTDGFDVSDVVYFGKEKQMWLTLDEHGERWLVNDPDDDDYDESLVEREGDMAALPEVSGDFTCLNIHCRQGMTAAGPCLLCENGKKLVEVKSLTKQSPPKEDMCEQHKFKARRA